MGIFAKFKDKVEDQFGILNDADDFLDRLKNIRTRFTAKVKAVEKLVFDVQERIEGAKELTDFSGGEYRRAIAILRDLQREMKDVERETGKLIIKAQKDKKIWAVVRSEITKVYNQQKKANVQIDKTMRSIATAESTHKAALRELAQEREEHRDPVKAKKKIVNAIAKTVGTITALAALVLIGG